MSGSRIINHGVSTPYNVYACVLTQAGIDAPTANILQNEAGAPTWARTGLGVYTATLAGAFDVAGNTVVMVQLSTGAAFFVTAVVTSANVITLNFFDVAGAAVDLAGIAFVEIRTY